MLTGKRAVDKNRPSKEHILVDWAKPYLTSKRKFFQIMDARIEGQYTQEAVLKAALLAVQCLSTEPKFRPKMTAVVKALEQLQDSGDDKGVHQNAAVHSSHPNSRNTPKKNPNEPQPSASPLST